MLFSQFKNKLKVIFSVICQFVHKPLGKAQKPVQWNIRHQPTTITLKKYFGKLLFLEIDFHIPIQV
jgi:hypothetical protein